MPLISDFEGIKVYMYNNGWEHRPPHFQKGRFLWNGR